MPVEPTSHPDRVAATLANLPDVRAARGGAVVAAPGPGTDDARIDLKLLQWRALAAAGRDARSRAHLATLPREQHPDLWAGAVQDGVARGFAVLLEETIALAPRAPAPLDLAAVPGAKIATGRELRKRKDLLVASGGARVRFTRKEGVLFVDRDAGLHSSNCLRFEARRDAGDLDAFAPVADERPRLYSAQFLQAQRYVECEQGQELLLAGRLGRGPIGWSVALRLTGLPGESTVQLALTIEHRLRDHRLRARFLGLPLGAIAHACTPVHEVVAGDGGGFVAFTLVRAVDRLLVDGEVVAVPAALCPGPLVHHFRLGARVDGDAG
jgi:hypothetical protein